MDKGHNPSKLVLHNMHAFDEDQLNNDLVSLIRVVYESFFNTFFVGPIMSHKT